jgi:hypothetical protein
VGGQEGARGVAIGKQLRTLRVEELDLYGQEEEEEEAGAVIKLLKKHGWSVGEGGDD